MITHNFSFNGSGGKISRLDASRNYAVPLTTQVFKDYSVEVDLSGYGQLAAVSLDGRLWLFQDGNSLDFVALRWDDSEGKMQLAETRHFDGLGDVVLARGLDWILTNNNIFLVTDEAPYVRQAALFDENIPGTFLYSALRNSIVPISGSDPFTKQAWGKRDDNGNSAGNARFSRDTHLLYPAGTHTFEQCYSLLPSVGDWIIFENFLIRRPDNPLSEHFNYMLNVRPLIPLELLDGTVAFGTGYNFDHRGIQLAYLDGKLWGRGLYHIGRVFILPAGFDQHGDPQAFYLYISNDFNAPDNPSGFHLSQAVDFKTFEGHTFALFNDCSDWNYADIRCRLMGGHLATSTSAHKNSFLSSFERSESVALGGKRTDSGLWSWLNGESWDFTYWRTSQRYLCSGDRLCLLSDGLWDKCEGTNSELSGYFCEWDCILSPQEIDTVYHRWLNLALASLGQDNPCGFVSLEPLPITGGACITAENSDVLELQDDASAVWHTFSQDNGKFFFDYYNLNALLLHDKGAQVFNNGLTPSSDYKSPTLRQWLAPADIVEAVSETGIIASADNSAFFTNFQCGLHREVLSPCSLSLTAAAYNDDKGNSCRLSFAARPDGLMVKHSLSNGSLSSIANWENIYKEAVKVNLLHSFEEGSYPPYLQREPVTPSQAYGDVPIILMSCIPKSDLFSDYYAMNGQQEDALSSYAVGSSRTFLPICVTKTTAHYSTFVVCEVYYEEDDIVRIQFFSHLPQDFDNYDKYRIYWGTAFLQSIDIELAYFDFSSGSFKYSTFVCPCDFSITQDYQTSYPYWWDAPYSSALVSVYDPLPYFDGRMQLLFDENSIYAAMRTYSREFVEADPDHAYDVSYSTSVERIGSLPAGLRFHSNSGECFSDYRWSTNETHDVTYPSGKTYTEEISYFPDIDKRKLLFFPSVEIVNVANNIAVGYSFVSTLVFRVIENGILFYIHIDAKEYLYRAQYYTYLDHNNFYVDAQGYKRSKTNFHFVYTQDSKRLLIFRSEYDPDTLTLNVEEAGSAQ